MKKGYLTLCSKYSSVALRPVVFSALLLAFWSCNDHVTVAIPSSLAEECSLRTKSTRFFKKWVQLRLAVMLTNLADQLFFSISNMSTSRKRGLRVLLVTVNRPKT